MATKYLILCIALCFIPFLSNCQTGEDYNLQLDTLSGKEAMLNEMYAKYSSKAVLQKFKGDTSCVELYYKNTRMAVMPYDYARFINYEFLKTIKYEVVSLKRNRKLLKVKIYVEEKNATQ